MMMKNIFAVFSGESAWIGGSDKDSEGTWTWLDTEDPFNFFNWEYGKNENINIVNVMWLEAHVSFSDQLLSVVGPSVYL